MALKIPADFSNDIKSRDTNLVPVVAINLATEYTHDHGSNILISTGVRNLELMKQASDAHEELDSLHIDTLPILLNIPSIKESIDIEKRNYKISSINIDISNFPYNGKIFSDIILAFISFI